MPATFLVARLRRKPFILWTEVWTRLQTPAHRLFFPLTRYIYRHADAVVAAGDHTKRYLVNEGVPSERVFVAATAINNQAYNWEVSDKDKASLRQELGIASEQQKIVLYLGRLEEVKGLPYLLEAFASLRRDDTLLILAGKGSKQSHLQQLAREKGITDRVIFAGYVPPEQAVPYYSLAHVYVLPSITVTQGKETWGMVVNEAMNQGVPVIATDAVGAAVGGLVQDGVNGFVVPERDSTALAQQLRRILDNPDLRQRLSQNARSVVASWDSEQMVMGFRQAIEYVSSQG